MGTRARDTGARVPGVVMLRAIVLLQVSQVLGRGLYILFSFYYINRAFGLEGKGVWAGLFALFSILSAASNLGFEVWLTREVAGGHICRRGAWTFLLKAKGPLWAAALAVGAVLCARGGYPPWAAAAFGVALVIEGIALAEQAIFEGHAQAGRIAMMSFLKSGGFALVALPVALLQPGSLTVFAWIFAGVLLLRAVYGRGAWDLLPESATPARPRSWRDFAVMGSFILVTIIYFKVDVLMLGFMQGMAAAGNYDNAYLFVEGVMFVSAAAGTMLYPRLVQAAGPAKAKLFDAMYKLILALGFCGTLAIGVLGEPLGRLFIGDLFEGAQGALTVLGFALPVMFVNGLLNRWLFSEHRERFALVCALGVAVFNVVGNYFLIPTHGPAGAALITVLTEGLLLAMWLLWGRRSPGLLVWTLVGFTLLGIVSVLRAYALRGVWVQVGGLLLFTVLFVYRVHVFRLVQRGVE